jgi:hypothetical protein
MKTALDAWIEENGDDFYKWNPLSKPETKAN